MVRTFKLSVLKTAKLFFLSFFVIFYFLFYPFSIVHANPKDRLKGYAWSDTIGWISFNCSNDNSCYTNVDYGVDVDSQGYLSGYAWSDAIGWISFSWYGENNRPDKRALMDLNTGELSGFAKALSGYPDDDNWDGDISLSGTSPDYGPVLDFNTYEFDGYAWGDTVVGWIDFKTPQGVVTYDPFIFDFRADKGLSPSDPVIYQGTVALQWQTQGATSCVASNGQGTSWTDTNPKSVGNPSAVSENIYNMIENKRFTLTCTDGVYNLVRNLDIFVKPPPPKINLDAIDKNIDSGATTTLTWIADYVSDCQAYGAWSGQKATGTGSEVVGPLTAFENNFILTCNSAYPADYPDPWSDNVIVNVEKLIMNFWVDAVELRPKTQTTDQLVMVPYNDTIKLNWTVEYANSCVASGEVPGFSGNVTSTDGTHSYETEKMTNENEGKIYRATLICSGNNNQTATSTIRIKIGNNPKYQEI